LLKGVTFQGGVFFAQETEVDRSSKKETDGCESIETIDLLSLTEYPNDKIGNIVCKAVDLDVPTKFPL